MCWEFVFIDTSATMCYERVCAFVSDYASVYSFMSVCVPLLVIMLVCIH